MSKPNYVCYQVELTEANASLIDKLNSLLLPGYGSTSRTGSKTTTEDDSSLSKSTSKKITMSAVKKAVTAAKKEHGMDFINECIEKVDGDTDETLAKNISSIDPDQYANFLTSLEAGPTESISDDDEDDFGDDFDDVEDEETVSADDVKAAVKAYAKEHGRDEAKAVMKKHKVGALSDIDDLPAAKLTKLFGAVA